jgi:hypothetical protein
MLGVVLPDAVRRGWHVPSRWAVALSCWAGVICVTAPTVFLRSIDLHWDLLTRSRLPHEALGGLTFQSLGWIGHVALLIVIGILWFDWLCGQDEAFFVRWVATPFVGGAVVLALTSCYQMAVDIRAVNPTVYARLLRATGTLFDANVAGAAAALWTGGTVLYGLHAFGRRWFVMLPVTALAWVAVWGSGSRSAFLSAALLTAGAAVACALFHGVKGRTLALGGAATIALGAVALLVLLRLSGSAPPDPRAVRANREAAGSRLSQPNFIGPLARFRSMTLRGQTASPRAFFLAMWNRDGYGLGANRMIAAYPGFGVGLGAFHEMVPEFAGSLPADNAQNWYRHQLAETGIVGSLGWIVFVTSFGWFVLRPRRGERPAVWAVRTLLVVFAVMSLVSMPGQDPAVAMSVWTFSAWYVVLAGMPATPRVPRWAWAVAGMIVLVCLAGTARLAAGPLRVPVRVQHSVSGDYSEYSYGFWPAETDGEGEFRWTGRRATTVVPSAGQAITVTAGVNFGDLASHPSHARVWVNGRLIIDGTLTADTPALTQTLPLASAGARTLIETWTDRTETAPPPDGRELGLMVRWTFR